MSGPGTRRRTVLAFLLATLASLGAAQREITAAPATAPPAAPQGGVPAAPAPDAVAEDKARATNWIETHRGEIVDLSLQVWRYAETALKETRSSRALADYAEKQGFRVTRGVAGMPTAFVAEYGKGGPVIAILGEYDALPGISQKAVPRPEPIEAGAPGHGCGHNLFGAGSLAAAAAIKDLIAGGRLAGTIRFYGTPAEESVGGKIYMIRDGLFRDVDVCVAWHPAQKNVADAKSSQAMVDTRVEFFGKAAHAAFDPWNGRSAVDALELFTHGVNMLREHVRPSVRMHYAILDGGRVPNVVPDYARVWLWIRDSKRTGVEEVLARVRQIAEGAGLMAGVRSELTVQGGDYEILVNRAGARLLYANLLAQPPLSFTPEEQDFAHAIQKASGVKEVDLRNDIEPLPEGPVEPEGGSTDVGDVSWVAPVLQLEVTTAPDLAPWHAWPVVATGGMSIGQKGMIYAARILAGTMVDLYASEETRRSIHQEFQRETQDFVYKAYVPDGPPTLPEAPRP